MKLPRPKTPAESGVVEFDFGAVLSAIDTATMSISAIGTDPLAAQVLVGPHSVGGAKVLQRVGSGVNHVDYVITCIASSGDDICELAATLRVRPAA